MKEAGSHKGFLGFNLLGMTWSGHQLFQFLANMTTGQDERKVVTDAIKSPSSRYAHSLSLSSSCRNRFASRCSLVALSATLRATLAAGRSWKELGLSGEAWATRQEGHNPFKVLHPIILARGSWFPLATHVRLLILFPLLEWNGYQEDQIIWWDSKPTDPLLSVIISPRRKEPQDTGCWEIESWR